MILSTLVTSQLHFEMCAGLYGHPYFAWPCNSDGKKIAETMWWNRVPESCFTWSRFARCKRCCCRFFNVHPSLLLNPSGHHFLLG